MQHITYHNKTKIPKSLLFIITSKKEEPNGTKLPNHARTTPTIAHAGEENKENQAKDNDEEEREGRL